MDEPNVNQLVARIAESVIEINRKIEAIRLEKVSLVVRVILLEISDVLGEIVRLLNLILTSGTKPRPNEAGAVDRYWEGFVMACRSAKRYDLIEQFPEATREFHRQWMEERLRGLGHPDNTPPPDVPGC